MTDYSKLIERCLKNEARAQKQLYEEFVEQMLGVCYRYTKSLADAEDILQEGFIKVFKNLHQFKFQGEFGGWIRRIMVTTAINYLKRSIHYQQDLLYLEESLHPISDQNPEVNIQTKDLVELIRQLPTGYQTVFNLFAVEGFTHAEIGKILGMKENTSRSQYMRARNLLIKWMEQHSVDDKIKMYAGK